MWITNNSSTFQIFIAFGEIFYISSDIRLLLFISKIICTQLFIELAFCFLRFPAISILFFMQSKSVLLSSIFQKFLSNAAGAVISIDCLSVSLSIHLLVFLFLFSLLYLPLCWINKRWISSFIVGKYGNDRCYWWNVIQSARGC